MEFWSNFARCLHLLALALQEVYIVAASVTNKHAAKRDQIISRRVCFCYMEEFIEGMLVERLPPLL
jgi:hypothetical protein